ncbi:MAG TPA: FAD binding domain-containing protein, partial [Gaiellaceae bacterium]|nr:FAD binding domain-containing protein [Gaiellaceae bacterium]
MRLERPSSREEAVAALGAGAVALAGGTEVVPLLHDGILQAETLVDVSAAVPRGIAGRVVGAGTTLAELEASDHVPDALREACRLAASPQLRNMGTIGGNLLQATRCWYWRLRFPCRLHGGDTCHAREG